MKARTAFSRFTAAAVALLLSGPALAGSGYLIASVTSVLMNADSTFGGCMAALSVSPQSVLPGCQPTWVSFSCSGDFTDTVRAYRMVDIAELALAADKPVYVEFSDDLKHNGYCFASRIDVLK